MNETLVQLAGRLHPRVGLVAVHGLLATGMTTAFGRHLIFDHHAGETRARIAAYRALHIQGVSVTGIAVADDRNGDRRADVVALVQHLGVGDEAGVRHADARGRHR